MTEHYGEPPPRIKTFAEIRAEVLSDPDIGKMTAREIHHKYGVSTYTANNYIRLWAKMQQAADHLPEVEDRDAQENEDTTEKQVIDPRVFEKDGVIVADSRDIAAYFHKAPDYVLKVIANILKTLTPSKLTASWFIPITYIDAKGESRPAFEVTRQGFDLVAMGFTGPEAMDYKVSYILEFDAREAALKNRNEHLLADLRKQQQELDYDNRKFMVERHDYTERRVIRGTEVAVAKGTEIIVAQNTGLTILVKEQGEQINTLVETNTELVEKTKQMMSAFGKFAEAMGKIDGLPAATAKETAAVLSTDAQYRRVMGGINENNVGYIERMILPETSRIIDRLDRHEPYLRKIVDNTEDRQQERKPEEKAAEPASPPKMSKVDLILQERTVSSVLQGIPSVLVDVRTGACTATTIMVEIGWKGPTKGMSLRFANWMSVYQVAVMGMKELHEVNYGGSVTRAFVPDVIRAALEDGGLDEMRTLYRERFDRDAEF